MWAESRGLSAFVFGSEGGGAKRMGVPCPNIVSCVAEKFPSSFSDTTQARPVEEGGSFCLQPFVAVFPDTFRKYKAMINTMLYGALIVHIRFGRGRGTKHENEPLDVLQ